MCPGACRVTYFFVAVQYQYLMADSRWKRGMVFRGGEIDHDERVGKIRYSRADVDVSLLLAFGKNNKKR